MHRFAFIAAVLCACATIEPSPEPRPLSPLDARAAELARNLEEAQREGDADAVAHWQRLTAWDKQQRSSIQAASIEDERGRWARTRPLRSDDTAEDLIGNTIRLDDTVERADEAYVYFKTPMATFCRRPDGTATHRRWGRRGGGHRASGWGRWRSRHHYSSGSSRRRASGRGHASEQDQHGVFWDPDFGDRSPAFPGWTTQPFFSGKEIVPPKTPPEIQRTPNIPRTPCNPKSWNLIFRMSQPAQFRFQAGDQVQLIGIPLRDPSGDLLLQQVQVKYIARAGQPLFAALPGGQRL